MHFVSSKADVMLYERTGESKAEKVGTEDDGEEDLRRETSAGMSERDRTHWTQPRMGTAEVQTS